MGRLFGNKDIAFLDAKVRENNRLFGTDATYYALDFKKTPKDALWGESMQDTHKSDPKKKTLGVCFDAFIEFPERTIRTGEEGQHTDYDAVLWIARKDFDEAYPLANPAPGAPVFRKPTIGDVVKVQGRYYDVVHYEEDGHYNDTVSRHATWKIKCKNRSEMDARRRIEGET